MSFYSEKIKQLNSLTDLLLQYGIQVDKKGFSRCPFHNEKTASFKVYSNNTFHCFGCGAHGDVITLVMKLEGLDFKEACKRLDGEITYSEQRKIDRIKREQKSKSEHRNSAKAEYWKAFDNWRNNEKIIELFRPASPDAQPSEEFLTALKHRGYFSYLLDCTENKLMKGV